MDLWEFLLLLSAIGNIAGIDALLGRDPMVCTKQTSSSICVPKARRYDITELGYKTYFHGWADVQGQGAANDYCRIVGSLVEFVLTCALAGTHGQSDMNYKSAPSFDIGYDHSWYMKDEDGDGRDDYCRCVGSETDQKIMCTKAGERGFYGSEEQGGQTNTFIVADSIKCNSQRVIPELGRS